MHACLRQLTWDVLRRNLISRTDSACFEAENPADDSSAPGTCRQRNNVSQAASVPQQQREGHKQVRTEGCMPTSPSRHSGS